jgi:MinD superfamily P-loop ATPase
MGFERSLVCVNKWDLNRDLTLEIEKLATNDHIDLAGKVRYDPQVTKAQIARRTLVEYAGHGAAVDIRRVWANVSRALC